MRTHGQGSVEENTSSKMLRFLGLLCEMMLGYKNSTGVACEENRCAIATGCKKSQKGQGKSARLDPGLIYHTAKNYIRGWSDIPLGINTGRKRQGRFDAQEASLFVVDNSTRSHRRVASRVEMHQHELATLPFLIRGFLRPSAQC